MHPRLIVDGDDTEANIASVGLPATKYGKFIKRNADGTVHGDCQKGRSGEIECTSQVEKMLFFEFISKSGLTMSPVIVPVNEKGDMYDEDSNFNEFSHSDAWYIQMDDSMKLLTRVRLNKWFSAETGSRISQIMKLNSDEVKYQSTGICLELGMTVCPNSVDAAKNQYLIVRGSV